MIAPKRTLPPDADNLNDDRARWARIAADVFARETGLTTDGDGYETIIGDLICDLHHLADREGIVWKAVIDRQDFHYEAETGGDWE